jgi:hypothetical protein
MGFSSMVGQYSDGYSTGLRMGALLGGHIGPFLSLNGELGVDITNPPGDVYTGTDRIEAFFDFTLSPLFHFGVPSVEYVVGPKIGSFAFVGSARESDGTRGPSYTLDYHGHGIVYGFTAGAFSPIGRVALGGILGFTGHSFSGSHCSFSTGGACSYPPIDTTLVSFSVAMML